MEGLLAQAGMLGSVILVARNGMRSNFENNFRINNIIRFQRVGV